MIESKLYCDICGNECNPTTLIKISVTSYENFFKGAKGISDIDVCDKCYQEILGKYRELLKTHEEDYESNGFKRERMIMFAGDVHYD